MLKHLLLLALFLNALSNVEALVFPQPPPTPALNQAHLINGWTPKPTKAPVTPKRGAIAPRDIFRRQTISETCAYSYTGDGYTSLVCPEGSACAYWYDDAFFACCTLDSAGGFSDVCEPATTCLDYVEHEYMDSSKYTGYSSVLW